MSRLPIQCCTSKVKLTFQHWQKVILCADIVEIVQMLLNSSLFTLFETSVFSSRREFEIRYVTFITFSKF